MRPAGWAPTLVAAAGMAACGILPAAAAQPSAGLTSGIVMKHNFSARAEAMGEAYTAVVSDAQAMLWNPSALAFLPGSEVSASLCSGLVDDSFGQVSYAGAFNRRVGWGAGLYTYNGGKFDLIDTRGNVQTLSAQSDILVVGSGSYRLSKNFSAGASLEVLNSTLLEQPNGTSVALIAGLTYLFADLPELRLGAAVRHLGLPLYKGSSGDPLPMTMAAGASYRILAGYKQGLPHEVLAAAEVQFSQDTPAYLNLGAEYWFKRMLAARVGYKLNRALEGFSLGFAFRYPLFGGWPLQLDYSFSPTSELNSLHKVSLSLLFPTKKAKAKEATDSER